MNGQEKPLRLDEILLNAEAAANVYAENWESSLVASLSSFPAQAVVSDGDAILTCPDNSPRSSILADYIASVPPQAVLRLLGIARHAKLLAENLRVAQSLAAANVSAVTVTPGAVLVIRIEGEQGPSTHDHFTELARNLSQYFPEGTPVLLTNDIDIRSLDEGTMRIAGWLKEPQWNLMSETPPFPFTGDICLTNGRIVKNADWCSGYWSAKCGSWTAETKSVSHWRHPTPEPQKP